MPHSGPVFLGTWNTCHGALVLAATRRRDLPSVRLVFHAEHAPGLSLDIPADQPVALDTGPLEPGVFGARAIQNGSETLIDDELQVLPAEDYRRHLEEASSEAFFENERISDAGEAERLLRAVLHERLSDACLAAPIDELAAVHINHWNPASGLGIARLSWAFEGLCDAIHQVSALRLQSLVAGLSVRGYATEISLRCGFACSFPAGTIDRFRRQMQQQLDSLNAPGDRTYQSSFSLTDNRATIDVSFAATVVRTTGVGAD